MSVAPKPPPSSAALPPGVVLAPGEGGLPRLSINTPLATAEVYLHGAHVARYQPAGQQPVLFLSGKSLFQSGKAIRGGVPIIFPWFGPCKDKPDLPSHGFARTQSWTLSSVTAASDGRTVIELLLEPNDQTRALWPHPFSLRYRIEIGSSLRLTLIVRNTGSDAFVFEEALHTYLKIADVHTTRVEDLSGRTYIDQLQADKHVTQDAEPITFTGETDRIYVNTPDAAEVHDPAGDRVLCVKKQHSLATVVWNPWIEKSKKMADFGDDEWPGMLCIETANCADTRITLGPGAQHEMIALISVDECPPDAAPEAGAST